MLIFGLCSCRVSSLQVERSGQGLSVRWSCIWNTERSSGAQVQSWSRLLWALSSLRQQNSYLDPHNEVIHVAPLRFHSNPCQRPRLELSTKVSLAQGRVPGLCQRGEHLAGHFGINGTTSPASKGRNLGNRQTHNEKKEQCAALNAGLFIHRVCPCAEPAPSLSVDI